MPTIATPRDPADVRDRFARWLAEHRGAEVEIAAISSPGGGGMSSETFLVDARVGGGRERLVLRLPPDGEGLFPRYDLGGQAHVLEVLHASTDVPVPRVVGYEPDPGPLGAPFLVMDEARGRIPTDQPSYLRTGWLHDAAPDDQRRLHRRFLATLAQIHRVDWPELGLDELARPGSGPVLRRDLAWWRGYVDWAADGEPVTRTRDALAWCEANAPPDAPAPSLLWGDARIPNVVFGDDLHVVAVLDWEMAGIGPAEVDLGWYLAIHRMSTVDGDLPGFLARDDALDWYEAHLGRAIARTTLDWYEAYGALRSAAIMVRMGRLLHDLELLPDRRLMEHNPCTVLLDALLG